MADKQPLQYTDYQFSTSFPLPSRSVDLKDDGISSLESIDPYQGRLLATDMGRKVASDFHDIFCETLYPALKKLDGNVQEVACKVASALYFEGPRPTMFEDTRERYEFNMYAEAYNKACTEAIFKPYDPALQHVYRDLMDKYARLLPNKAGELGLGPFFLTEMLGPSGPSWLVQLCESCAERKGHHPRQTIMGGYLRYGEKLTSAQKNALPSVTGEVFKACKVCSVRVGAFMHSMGICQSTIPKSSSTTSVKSEARDFWKTFQGWVPVQKNGNKLMQETIQFSWEADNPLLNASEPCIDCHDRLEHVCYRNGVSIGDQGTAQSYNPYRQYFVLDRTGSVGQCEFSPFPNRGVSVPGKYHPLENKKGSQTDEKGVRDEKEHKDKKCSTFSYGNRYEPPPYILSGSEAQDLEKGAFDIIGGHYGDHGAPPSSLHHRASATGDVYVRDNKEAIEDQKHIDERLSKRSLYADAIVKSLHRISVRKRAARNRTSVRNWLIVVGLFLILGTLYHASAIIQRKADILASQYENGGSDGMLSVLDSSHLFPTPIYLPFPTSPQFPLLFMPHWIHSCRLCHSVNFVVLMRKRMDLQYRLEEMIADYNAGFPQLDPEAPNWMDEQGGQMK
ncbi:MAG: hypothetical protein Q9222_004584 [Ikaeria aurantiellina]